MPTLPGCCTNTFDAWYNAMCKVFGEKCHTALYHMHCDCCGKNWTWVNTLDYVGWYEELL